MEELDPIQLAITIVTVEEVLSGWYASIRRARTDEAMAVAYKSLQESVSFVSRVRILPFGLQEVRRWRRLRQMHRRVGTNDLKIASIVLEHSATLVTRNTSDFKVIEGLNIENWAD